MNHIPTREALKRVIQGGYAPMADKAALFAKRGRLLTTPRELIEAAGRHFIAFIAQGVAAHVAEQVAKARGK